MSNNTQLQQLVINLMSYLEGYNVEGGRKPFFKVATDSGTLSEGYLGEDSCYHILYSAIEQYGTTVEVSGYPGYLFNYENGISLEVYYTWE